MINIQYPANLSDYKQLRKFVTNNKFDSSTKKVAKSFITQWRVVTGAHTLEVLVKMSGKKQKTIADELGISPRLLSEMIMGLNNIKNYRKQLASYFQVEEELLNDNRQIRKVSKD